MVKAPIPSNEDERLQELYRYSILDSDVEEIFDNITSLVASTIDVKMATISFIDRDRQWFKSAVGMERGEASREDSFCGHTIMSDDVLVVEDPQVDERFKDNPYVVADDGLRFYAGAPLVSENGFRIGTICAFDNVKKSVGEKEILHLETVAKTIMNLLEIRLKNLELLSVASKNIEQSKYLELALEGAQLGVWDWYLEDDSVRFDERWANMLGLSIDEIKMELETWKSRVHKDDIDNCFKDITNYMEGRTKQYENIHRMRHKEGHWVYILDKGKFSDWDESGKPIRFTGTHLDITEQKERENTDRAISRIRQKYIELQDDNQKFFDYLLKQVIDLTESEYGFIGEIKTREDGTRFLKTYALTDISWNKETKEFYEKEAPNGLEFTNLNTLFGKVIKSEELLITNSPKAHPDAGGIPVGHPDLNAFMGIPIKNSNKYVAMAGIANREGGYSQRMYDYLLPLFEFIGEIITQYNLKKEKEKNEVQSKIILDATGVATWTLDMKTMELKWDDNMYALYGKSKNDFHGVYEDWASSLLPKSRKRAEQEFQDALKSENKFELVFDIKPGKKKKTIKARGEIKRNERGEPTQILGVNWDFTSEQQYNKLLVVARDRAEQFAKAKSQFLANMSHEIRTPMNGIIGMIELLSTTEINTEQRDMISTIKSSGESLLTILNDILDFSKIESGMIELEAINFDLEKCLNESIFLIDKIASEKGVQINYKNTGKYPKYLVGDVTRIRQVITNLLSNAVKFTNAGKNIFVEVENLKQDNNQVSLCISVRDEGIGIGEENQSKLFKAFSQADETITREYGGTGLGLSICARLVDLMKGHIEVESELGKGSCFKVFLNFQLGSEVEELKQVSFSEGFSKEYPHKILIVEDNKINQKIARMMFKRLGYECDFAQDGLEALEASQQTKYSLIFMDMQMPKMDGVTATREIIKRDRNSAPPIIAMTANALEEDKQKCIDAGMCGYIVKPVKLDALAKIITENS